MDIFTKLPYISLLVHEQLWLSDKRDEYNDNLEEFERKFLYKDQKSVHNARFCFNNGKAPDECSDEMALDSFETHSNIKTESNHPETSLTKYIELDNVECYEYDPEILESPLSPDGESLGRNSKIGLDVWNWNRTTNPLGYSPPLCTCKNLRLLHDYLQVINNGQMVVMEVFKTCPDPNCCGLLYIPYSLIEIPLDRKIDNAMSFTNHVKIPDNTDIYCGSLKHTLVLCTINLEHENICLQAIKDANIECHLIYDVINNGDAIPFFTPINTINNNVISSNVNNNSSSKPKAVSGENKVLTLLLDETDDSHSQTAISGQYLVTMHKLEHNKVGISKIMKKQGGDFKPLDTHFFEALKRSIDPKAPAVNVEFPINSDNCSNYKILDTANKVCEMRESYFKERRPLNFSLRSMPNHNFGTIKEMLCLSAEDADILNEQAPAKPLKIDQHIKHHVIGNLYKMSVANQLSK